ncbi:MAG: SDR family oxidoreductase [Rhodospirillales bacterium]|nr:SDR family oxidoreductase [Rhodospirillales bacterium]
MSTAPAFAGKTVIVTGGGFGIGEAIVRAFAAAGAKVAIADIDKAKCDRVAKAVNGIAVPTDVADEASVKALFATVERETGRLDVIVNNAGVIPRRGPASEMDMADWDRTIAVNVRGVILCMKYSIPLLKKTQGTIVNMASLSGIHGRATHSGYSASKFAVCGITESLAQEVGPYGIRVNSICPGTVNTPSLLERTAIRAKAAGRDTEELIATDYRKPAALNKLVEMSEIADTALFLAGPDSGAITGQHLIVSAGRR